MLRFFCLAAIPFLASPSRTQYVYGLIYTRTMFSFTFASLYLFLPFIVSHQTPYALLHRLRFNAAVDKGAPFINYPNCPILSTKGRNLGTSRTYRSLHR